MIDLSFNYPSTAGQDELTRRYMTEVLNESNRDLSSPVPYFGNPNDVEAVKTSLIGCEPEQETPHLALVCSGQAALVAAMASVCTRPGLCFAAEPWTFPQFIGALPLFGASAVPVQMDEQGIVPDSLVKVCEQENVSALYTMPTFHNPLGIVMPQDRREAIATIARRYNLFVIEDDAYAFLEAERLPSIRSFAPERTLQIFSLSKMVSLSLRLGALVVPDAIAPRTADYIRFAGISAHPVATGATASMVRDAHLPELAAGKRAEGAARYSIAKQILGDHAQPLHPHSWHILVSTPNATSGKQFAERAQAESAIIVSPAAGYRLDGRDEPAVRVSFGGEATRDRVTTGMQLLADLLKNSN